MSREATINVSLTPEELRLVRQRVNSGDYGSASELVRDGLRMLFLHGRSAAHPSARKFQREIARGYKVLAKQDRKLAGDWSILIEAWPRK